jgi:hypothetical protein
MYEAYQLGPRAAEDADTRALRCAPPATGRRYAMTGEDPEPGSFHPVQLSCPSTCAMQARGGSGVRVWLGRKASYAVPYAACGGKTEVEMELVLGTSRCRVRHSKAR